MELSKMEKIKYRYTKTYEFEAIDNIHARDIMSKIEQCICGEDFIAGEDQKVRKSNKLQIIHSNKPPEKVEL